MTTEMYIKKAQERHGNKYDYSSTVFVDWNTLIFIGCSVHGQKEVSPRHHIYGKKAHGCKQCGQEAWATEKNQRARLSFLNRVKAIYGDKYDYSHTIYSASKAKIVVICPKHGSFSTTPNRLLRGKGCSKCGDESAARKRSKGTKKFIAEAQAVHGDRYDYSKVDYFSCSKKIIIICRVHGEFQQLPQNHLKGHDCEKCGFLKTGDGLRKLLEDFLAAARATHGNKYDYSKVVYINTKTEVEIICPEHGSFKQAPGNHIKGSGCLLCVDIFHSKFARKIEDWLITNEIKYEREKTFENCRSKKRNQRFRFDFFLPNQGIIIEYDGQQHFRSVEHWGGNASLQANIANDKIKNEWAKKNGFKMLRISFIQKDEVEDILEKHCLVDTSLEFDFG